MAMLGITDALDMAGLHVADGMVYVTIARRSEPPGIYRVPTVNLDTARAETRRGARANVGRGPQWSGAPGPSRDPRQASWHAARRRAPQGLHIRAGPPPEALAGRAR